MKSSNTPPQNIDEYIAQFPSEIQEILENIRKVIRITVPEAEETISYQIPTFKWKGVLVHFAAFKQHIGFYPTPNGIDQFRKELSPYETAKGSVKFPLAQPIPYDLIKTIVDFRVKENEEREKLKKSRK